MSSNSLTPKSSGIESRAMSSPDVRFQELNDLLKTVKVPDGPLSEEDGGKNFSNALKHLRSLTARVNQAKSALLEVLVMSDAEKKHFDGPGNVHRMTRYAIFANMKLGSANVGNVDRAYRYQSQVINDFLTATDQANELKKECTDGKFKAQVAKAPPLKVFNPNPAA